jgi:hypothetical protein
MNYGSFRNIFVREISVESSLYTKTNVIGEQIWKKFRFKVNCFRTFIKWNMGSAENEIPHLVYYRAG